MVANFILCFPAFSHYTFRRYGIALVTHQIREIGTPNSVVKCSAAPVPTVYSELAPIGDLSYRLIGQITNADVDTSYSYFSIPLRYTKKNLKHNNCYVETTHWRYFKTPIAKTVIYDIAPSLLSSSHQRRLLESRLQSLIKKRNYSVSNDATFADITGS